MKAGTDGTRKGFGPLAATLICVLIVLLAFLCSRYCFQLMLIQGESMAPTYHNLQLVVLDKRGEAYEPGEVIAFRCDGLNAVLVKRVAAGPGDTAQIVEGTLRLNGAVSAVYPNPGIFRYAGLLEAPVTLGEGEYLVIGDNIEQSKDSRYEAVGIVRTPSVLGRIPGSARTAPDGISDADSPLAHAGESVVAPTDVSRDYDGECFIQVMLVSDGA